MQTSIEKGAYMRGTKKVCEAVLINEGQLKTLFPWEFSTRCCSDRYHTRDRDADRVECREYLCTSGVDAGFGTNGRDHGPDMTGPGKVSSQPQFTTVGRFCRSRSFPPESACAHIEFNRSSMHPPPPSVCPEME